MLKTEPWGRLGVPPSPCVCAASTSRSTRRTWTLGDYVVVVNAEKVRVTGNKERGQKLITAIAAIPAASRPPALRSCGRHTRSASLRRRSRACCQETPWGRAVFPQAESLCWSRPTPTPPSNLSLSRFSWRGRKQADGVIVATEVNYGTGRRKTSAARVFHNWRRRQDHRQLAARWTTTSGARTARMIVRQPLEVADLLGHRER